MTSDRNKTKNMAHGSGSSADDTKEALLEARIAELPRGYISRKKIAGKERLYLQWREDGKVRSRYIKEAERESVISGVAERRELEAELSSIKAAGAVAEEAAGYTSRPKYYFKWGDEVIGRIDSGFKVTFIKPELNDVVRKYAPKSGVWNRQDLIDFLQDRIVSPGRRDIEQILFRCGLTAYDPIQIGLKTHAISARDLLWITEDKSERFEDAVTEVFDSVFMKGADLTGDGVDTPEGQNIKRYGVSRGKYGIYKKRLTPLSYDAESEIAVYMLGERLGVPCCPCWKTDDDTVFSQFRYDFSKEYIVHFRRLIEERKYDSDLRNLIAARPGYIRFFAGMIALDFITRQDDRHLSNIAIKVSPGGEEPYPLYDNGRSLFYEDTESTIRAACGDIGRYAAAFGPAGTYLDHVHDLSDIGISFRKLLRLGIQESEVRDILEKAGFTGFRLDGASEWIMKCVDILEELG